MWSSRRSEEPKTLVRFQHPPMGSRVVILTAACKAVVVKQVRWRREVQFLHDPIVAHASRVRDGMTRVSQCSAGSHKPRRPGATPGPATWPGTQIWKSGQVENLACVGSSPTLANFEKAD